MTPRRAAHSQHSDDRIAFNDAKSDCSDRGLLYRYKFQGKIVLHVISYSE